MINLTASQIAAAQNHDLDALGAVMSEMEERVGQLAHKYSTTAQRTDETLREDLAQVGRIAVWESLARFEGSSVAEFFAYMNRTVSGKLAAERRITVRQGVSEGTAARFEKALVLASGDAYEAQRIAQDNEHMGDQKLSAEMAYAARLSWQGVDALDATVGRDADGSAPTLLDRVANTHATEDVADFAPTKRTRPVSWLLVSRALEAHVTVPANADARSLLMAVLGNIARGEISASDVVWLEGFVTVPKAELARKELCAAMAMLRGFLTQTEEGEEVPEESIAVVRARETRAAVRATLAKMGKLSANILRGTFGLSPAPMTFGVDNDDLLADWVGTKPSLVRQNRSKAKKAFAKLFLAGAAA